MGSRSGLERLTALVLASGVALSSSLGSHHDSRSGHHAMGSAQGMVNEAVAGAGPFEAHSPAHSERPSDRVPDECPCLGGICVLSARGGPIEQPVTTVLDGDAPAYLPLPSRLPISAGKSAPELQPPGRAPPAVV